MQNISSTTELNEVIRLLEIEQAANGLQLREEFHRTYESLKPVNVLKSTLKDINSSPLLMTTMAGTTAGLVSGYLSKKIVVGSSDNLFRKLLGTILQIGVANIVAQHPDAIKSVGQFALRYVLRMKELNSIKE